MAQNDGKVNLGSGRRAPDPATKPNDPKMGGFTTGPVASTPAGLVPDPVQAQKDTAPVVPEDTTTAVLDTAVNPNPPRGGGEEVFFRSSMPTVNFRPSLAGVPVIAFRNYVCKTRDPRIIEYLRRQAERSDLPFTIDEVSGDEAEVSNAERRSLGADFAIAQAAQRPQEGSPVVVLNNDGEQIVRPIITPIPGATGSVTVEPQSPGRSSDTAAPDKAVNNIEDSNPATQSPADPSKRVLGPDTIAD